jgi:hypothetical protein
VSGRGNEEEQMTRKTSVVIAVLLANTTLTAAVGLVAVVRDDGGRRDGRGMPHPVAPRSGSPSGAQGGWESSATNGAPAYRSGMDGAGPPGWNVMGDGRHDATLAVVMLALAVGSSAAALVLLLVTQRPWRPATVIAASGVPAGPAGGATTWAAGGPAGTLGASEQWAQWHRETHAAEEAATQPLATPAKEAGVAGASADEAGAPGGSVIETVAPAGPSTGPADDAPAPRQDGDASPAPGGASS